MKYMKNPMNQTSLITLKLKDYHGQALGVYEY
jgi:hypothetical protein